MGRLVQPSTPSRADRTYPARRGRKGLPRNCIRPRHGRLKPTKSPPEKPGRFSLEVGKYADLTILGDDPTEVNPMKIEDIIVSETWLAGEQKIRA